MRTRPPARERWSPAREWRLWRARPQLVMQVGERVARLLVTERQGGGVRVRRAITVDLRAEGLLSSEETATHLRTLAAAEGALPASVVLPLGRALSQVMELREPGREAVRQLAQSLAGRQFDDIESVFGSQQMRAAGSWSNPVWVTVAQEADVELHLARCGLPEGRVARVTSADNALVCALRTLGAAAPADVVLIELAAVASTLVIVQGGQPVFSATFDLGAEMLVEALAGDMRVGAGEAAIVLRRDGAAVLDQPRPGLAAALGRWRQEVEKLLAEFARESGATASPVPGLPRWVSGPSLGQPGWVELLSTAGGATLGWPDVQAADGARVPLAEYAVPYGAAVAGHGLVVRPPDLSPRRWKQARQVKERTGWMHVASLLMVAFLGLTVLSASWRHYSAVKIKARHLAELEQARDGGPRVASALARREDVYRAAVPALYLEQRTRDLITGLRLLRAERPKDDGFWYALVADGESYRAGGVAEEPQPGPWLLADFLSRPTGLIVELSLAPSTNDKLGIIGGLAGRLRGAGRFASVDILPARARQPLADPAVLAPESDFALSLEEPAFVHMPAGPDAATGEGTRRPLDSMFTP